MLKAQGEARRGGITTAVRDSCGTSEAARKALHVLNDEMVPHFSLLVPSSTSACLSARAQEKPEVLRRPVTLLPCSAPSSPWEERGPSEKAKLARTRGCSPGKIRFALRRGPGRGLARQAAGDSAAHVQNSSAMSASAGAHRTGRGRRRGHSLAAARLSRFPDCAALSCRTSLCGGGGTQWGGQRWSGAC